MEQNIRNARLALRQRANLFMANISVKKISPPSSGVTSGSSISSPEFRQYRTSAVYLHDVWTSACKGYYCGKWVYRSLEYCDFFKLPDLLLTSPN